MPSGFVIDRGIRYDPPYVIADDMQGVDLTLSGRLRVSGDSESLPSIANRTDIDTGLYWPATDQIAVSVAGAQRLSVSTTELRGHVESVVFRRETSAVRLILDAPAGQSVGLSLRRGDVRRWGIFANDAAESGGNTGSDLVINRWSDDGTLLDPDGIMRIRRSDGTVYFCRSVSLTSGFPLIAWHRSTSGTNQKAWAIQVGSDDVLRLVTYDDNYTSSSPIIEFRRSGTSSHGAVVQSAAIDQPLAVNVSNTGLGAYMGFRRSGQTRWVLGANADAETGSNEGSNFAINCYADNGSYLATPLYINRRWSVVSVNGELYVSRSGGDVLHINATQQSQYGTIAFKRNSVQRWSIGMTNAGESSGNAGSHFEISRFADNGAWISAPLSIERNTGTTIIRNGLSVQNSTIGVLNASGGHVVNLDVQGGEFALMSIYRNGARRWAIGMNNAAETGGNAGSNFEIRRYGDSGGSAIDVPLWINRQNGAVTVTGQHRGFVVVPSNVYTTIYTLSQNVSHGIVHVTLAANAGGGPVDEYSAFAIWQRQVDGLCYLRVIWNGIGCNLRVWGSAIEYYQTSGAAQGVCVGIYELFR